MHRRDIVQPLKRQRAGVQQDTLRATQVLSFHAAPAHRYYFLMPATVQQFSPISPSNSAACEHDAEVKVVFSETVNLSMNDVSKASLLSYRHLTR